MNQFFVLCVMCDVLCVFVLQYTVSVVKLQYSNQVYVVCRIFCGYSPILKSLFSALFVGSLVGLCYVSLLD